MAKQKPKFPFGTAAPVLVEWQDSGSNGRWSTREEYHKKATTVLSPIRSVGWINRKDNACVQVLQSQSGATGDVADAITIPRSCVRRIHRLRM